MKILLDLGVLFSNSPSNKILSRKAIFLRVLFRGVGRDVVAETIITDSSQREQKFTRPPNEKVACATHAGEYGEEVWRGLHCN